MSTDTSSVVNLFRKVTHAIMDRFPTEEDFDDTEVCAALAYVSMEMASYYIAHMACSHILDHPKDGGNKCAMNIIRNAGEIFGDEARTSFETLLMTLKLDDPFDDADLTINEQTRDAILGMLKKVESDS